MTVYIVCPDCRSYLAAPAERDGYSGEAWPIDDEVPEHKCEWVSEP